MEAKSKKKRKKETGTLPNFYLVSGSRNRNSNFVIEFHPLYLYIWYNLHSSTSTAKKQVYMPPPEDSSLQKKHTLLKKGKHIFI